MATNEAIYVAGIIALAQGFIVSSMLLAATAVHVIERRFVRDAADEDRANQAWLHAVTAAFNTGLGAAIGVGVGNSTAGIIDGAVGIALGELFLGTRPRGLLGALERYRSGQAP